MKPYLRRCPGKKSGIITGVLILLCCFIAIPQANAQSKYTISGTVTDTKGETIPGATVFLSGTKIITATDGNGKYILRDVLPGSYVIVAKFMGFAPLSLAANITDQPLTIDMVLHESVNQLNQVTIKADPNWAAYYREFKKVFLGSTPNAAQCDINNKEALHFHLDKATGTLNAYTDDFIEIENRALGYNIRYALESFKLNRKTGLLNYQGFPVFKEMTPKSAEEDQLWQKNRDKAFYGSINHLIQSIYRQNSYQQGFRLYSTDYDVNWPLDDKGNEKVVSIDPQPVLLDSLLSDGDDNLKLLSFKKTLFIVYVNEKEPFNFKNSGYLLRRPFGAAIPSGQYSMVSLMENDVTINAQGNYGPPDGLAFKGFMAWEQIAELTPLNYKTISGKQP